MCTVRSFCYCMIGNLLFTSVYQKTAILDARVLGLTRKGYQPGTSRNLHYQINRYLDFCLEHKYVPAPCSNIQLRRFAAWVADTPKIAAYGTVSNYISAVRTFHKIIGLPPPQLTEHLTSLTLKGLRLEMAQPTKQAFPVTPQIFSRMFAFVDVQSPEQVTAWSALIFVFHLLLRKSNIVPDTQAAFDPNKQLTRGSLTLAANAMLVNIVWSKTLQFREKELLLPLVALANKIICPVFWAWQMIQLNPANANSPAFSYYRGNRFMTLTYPRLTFWFKLWLTQAGYDATKFTMHSLRRGGATFLHEADIPGKIIQLLGNWASDCYLRYIDLTLQKRVEAAHQFAALVDDAI